MDQFVWRTLLPGRTSWAEALKEPLKEPLEGHPLGHRSLRVLGSGIEGIGRAVWVALLLTVLTRPDANHPKKNAASIT